MPHHSEGSERGQVLLGLISVELIIITNFYKLGFPYKLKKRLKVGFYFLQPNLTILYFISGPLGLALNPTNNPIIHLKHNSFPSNGALSYIDRVRLNHQT